MVGSATRPTHPTSPLMREILEQQLARFEELERLMVDPDVLANPARLAAIARTWLAGQIGDQVPPLQAAQHPDH